MRYFHSRVVDSGISLCLTRIPAHRPVIADRDYACSRRGSYMFGVYSQNLKETSWPGGNGDGGTLTQAQVSLIGAASNIGGNFAMQWGFFFDYFGPRPTVMQLCSSLPPHDSRK